MTMWAVILSLLTLLTRAEDCSMGPFVLLDNSLISTPPTTCITTTGTTLCPALISDDLATRMIETLLQFYCATSPNVMWIGPLGVSMVYSSLLTPATGINNSPVEPITFTLYQKTVPLTSFTVIQPVTIAVSITPTPVTTSITVVTTVPTVTTTNPLVLITTLVTATTFVSLTISESAIPTTITVTSSIPTIVTQTITTSITTFITELTVDLNSTVDTATTTILSSITMISLTDGAITDIKTITETDTFCPSKTTTVITTSTTRSKTRITTTIWSTISTQTSTSTTVTTTGPCSTVTRTEEQTCTLLDTTTVSQTIIVPSAKRQCYLGQRVEVCGSVPSDDGLILVMSKVPKEQAKCVCESIGKRAAMIDDEKVLAAASLVHRCIGPWQYAWIGAINKKIFKDHCMAVQSGASKDSTQGAKLGRPQPCSAFLPILCE